MSKIEKFPIPSQNEGLQKLNNKIWEISTIACHSLYLVTGIYQFEPAPDH